MTWVCGNSLASHSPEALTLNDKRGGCISRVKKLADMISADVSSCREIHLNFAITTERLPIIQLFNVSIDNTNRLIWSA